jgi:hypothetical protein
MNVNAHRSSTSPPCDSTINIVGYLRGNGIEQGFIDVPITGNQPLKSLYLWDLFKRRTTGHRVYYCTQTSLEVADNIVVVFDSLLHRGPMGLIKTPYLLMKRGAVDDMYISLGEHD